MTDVISQLRAALAGRYEIVRELGRGGMATVYLAQDVQHDRPVAIKVLDPQLSASIGATRFQREIRVAARLQHPHILGIYDSGEAGEYLWFSMPFVEGESLRDRLNRETQLPVNESVRIAREVALALDFAHRHDIVHRDIKPENILLMDGQAMVADFGIARAMSQGDQSLTGTGIAIGTPGYMSPEQASAEANIDARTDVYALGCVLYEMLAGEAPFTGPTVSAVIARVMTEDARPLATVRSSVPADLAAAVNRAMAKTPADRPQTAGEFARLLETTVTSSYTAATPARRSNRWAWLAAAGIVLAVLGGIALWARSRSAPIEGSRRIAVLPFENTGSADDEYFADGMTDEVRSRLSSIGGLRVTARASSSQYKRSQKSPRAIGHELDVQYILTGTVRWSKEKGVNRVRVTPELIEVSNESSKWSQPYDTVLSDVFAIQASIASKVANALNVALAEPALERIDRKPTTNIDAYDEFLKGEQITNSMGTSDGVTLQKGLEHYDRAVQLDSGFVRAWSAIARSQASINGTGPTKEGVERARVAAERTLQLAPDRAEGHLAMGAYLVNIKVDFEGGRAQYLEGLKHDPNNADLLSGLAGSERALGKFDDALAHARQAFVVDPRSVNAARRVAGALHDLRRFQEELPAWDRALALAPQNLGLIQGKATGYVSLGQLDSAHALIYEKLRSMDTTAVLARFSIYGEQMWVLPAEFWPKILTLSVKDFGNDKGHWGLKIGHTYRLLGDSVHARAFGDSARIAFGEQLKQFPERAQLHELLGRALALGGHKKEAIEEADVSLKMRETSLDFSLKPYVHYQVARILIQSGEYQRAMDLLEPLLTANATDITPAYLRIDPVFKPLYGNPRFDRMAGR